MTQPASGLDEARLERLSKLAARLLHGRPLHRGGRQLHPRPARGGVEFFDHRPMMPGDDPRHLDWRASARSRQPLVRRFRDERAGEWTICLDHSASMNSADGVWPLARQLTGALAYLLLSLEHRVGLVLFADSIRHYLPPARGRTAYVAIQRLLQSATPLSSGGSSRLEACLKVLPRSRQVAVVSDFLRPDAMAETLGDIFARCGDVQVFHVHGQAPPELPSGPLTVEDTESGERLMVHADDKTGESLEREQRALNRGLEQFCQRKGLAYCASPVGTSWEQVLLGHLLRSGGRLA